MRRVVRCKSAITSDSGSGDDDDVIEYLVAMRSKMDVRHELWKYFEVCTSAIQEWKEMSFTKVVVS